MHNVYELNKYINLSIKEGLEMTGKGKFEFPDKIGTKKIPTIGETQKNDDRNFGKVDAVQPTYENKHTSKPGKHYDPYSEKTKLKLSRF